MPYSSFIPPVSEKKPTNLSVSFDRIDIVIFLFHVFFFSFDIILPKNDVTNLAPNFATSFFRVGGRKRENAGSEVANFALLWNILRWRYSKQLFTSDFYTL